MKRETDDLSTINTFEFSHIRHDKFCICEDPLVTKALTVTTRVTT